MSDYFVDGSDFFSIPTIEEEFEEKKNRLIKNMDFLKNLSVEENVFYRKYWEINQNYSGLSSRISSAKATIWTPTDIYNKELTIKELTEIKPEVLFVDPENSHLMKDWLMLRIFCHTMEYDQNPGRFLRFLIIDTTTGKYLGATSVVSDVISLGPREEYIGWTQDDKLKNGKLQNSAIGSCIMPTQPFGFNFIGGKLVACLTAGIVVQNKWKELYGQTLVGLTTTSLYGTGSMYDGMPKYWASIGESAGKVAIKPDETEYEYWHSYIKSKFPDEYLEKMTQKEGVSGPVTGAKQKAMQMIFKAVGIKSSDYQHGYKRGVYYALIYKNGKEFLQSKITEDQLVKKDQWKTDSLIVEWWREKAIRRYEKLHSENRLKPDILFYDKLEKTRYHEIEQYEDAKKIYFSEVGR